jgi:hypothetical protein
MRYIARKAGQRFEQAFGQNPYNNNTKRGKPEEKEGSISIDKMPKRRKDSKSDLGDYVDYEEID